MKSCLPKSLRRGSPTALTYSSLIGAETVRRWCPVVGSAKPGYLPERTCSRRRGHSGEHDYDGPVR